MPWYYSNGVVIKLSICQPGLNKMVALLLRTFWNSFRRNTIFLFWFKFVSSWFNWPWISIISDDAQEAIIYNNVDKKIRDGLWCQKVSVFKGFVYKHGTMHTFLLDPASDLHNWIALLLVQPRGRSQERLQCQEIYWLMISSPLKWFSWFFISMRNVIAEDIIHTLENNTHGILYKCVI